MVLGALDVLLELGDWNEKTYKQRDRIFADSCGVKLVRLVNSLGDEDPKLALAQRLFSRIAIKGLFDVRHSITRT